MGSQLSQMSYNLTDMYWLGRLSTGAVAATGVAGMYLWLSMALLMVGRMGAEIGVSQNLGRGDSIAAQSFGENAFMLSIALGVAYGAALYIWQTPLVGFFNIQELDVAAEARTYLSIVSFSVPFSFANAALTGYFTASGNSRMPFYMNSAGFAINMALDPLMIFGLRLGVAGAALATIIAQAISFALMAVAAVRAKNRPFERFRFFSRPNPETLRRIIRWSAPISAESAFFTFMTMITSRMISPFGQTALAVGRIGSQIESLSWLLAGGYGSALTAYMGQNYGSSQWSRIRRGFNISMAVMGIWGAIITVFMYTLGGQTYWLFLPDPDVRALGVMYLRILAVCQLSQCFEAVAGAAFKGCGRTLPPSIVSIVSNVLRVLLAMVFVRIWGVTGVWGAISLTAALRGITTLTWYLAESRNRHIRPVLNG